MGKTEFYREKIERYFRGKESEPDKVYITEIFRDAENEKELRRQKFMKLLPCLGTGERTLSQNKLSCLAIQIKLFGTGPLLDCGHKARTI